MTLKSTSRSVVTDPVLSGYMMYLPDEGMDLTGFVRRGGHLITTHVISALRDGMPELREKIAAISLDWPQLGKQLEFLAWYFETGLQQPRGNLPNPMFNETAFALLYAATEMDLAPDGLPGVGYSDDTAVVRAVLDSHGERFERLCKKHRISWSEIRPRSES